MAIDRVEDFSKDGKCSKCGGCCTNYLPATAMEFKRLKAWVLKNDFRPKKVEDALDATCPFLDKETLTCVCYDVRPSICRVFFCHDYTPNIKLPHKRRKYQVRNLRAEIFNEEVLTYSEWLAAAEYIRKKGEKPYATFSDSEQS